MRRRCAVYCNVAGMPRACAHTCSSPPASLAPRPYLFDPRPHKPSASDSSEMVSEKYLTELNKPRTSRSRASQSGPRRTGYGGSGTPHASRVRKGGKKTGIRIVNLGSPTDNDSATGPTGVYCYFPRSLRGSRAAACGCGQRAGGPGYAWWRPPDDDGHASRRASRAAQGSKAGRRPLAVFHVALPKVC